MVELRIRQQITAPFLSASAEVKKFESHAGYYLLAYVIQDGSNK